MFVTSLRTVHSLLIGPALLPLFFLIGAETHNNGTPVAVNDEFTIHACSDLDLMANDSDPDGIPMFIPGFPQSPAHGQLSRGANVIFYCASYGYVGPDSFTYTLCENQGDCVEAAVSLTIVNQPPVDERMSTRYMEAGPLVLFSQTMTIPIMTPLPWETSPMNAS